MIKRLLKSVREYKKDSVLAPLYVSLEVVMEVLIPLMIASLIDKGINQGNMSHIVKIGIVLAVSCLISLVFGVLSGRCAARASAGFAKNLRHDAFYRVQNYSFSNIDKFSSASIVTRLTTDITHLQNAYQMIIRIAVRGPMMLIFSFGAAVVVNAKLSLVFLILMPILAVGLYLIMTHAHPIFARVFKTYDRLNRVVQENLHGMRVVKAFVREQHETEKFNGVSDNIYKDFSRVERMLAFNAPLMQICMYSGILLISWFGAHMIVGGSMTTGELMSFLTYGMQILMSLMSVSMIFVMIVISRASAERVAELLNEESDIQNGESPEMAVQDGSIVFENVSFGYKENLCLHDVNLQIKSGETVGIIGGTGSAKSTLVQLIPRLYDVSMGCVKVGGRDVRDYDLTALRDSVAMVLQKNVLFSGTIKENLRWGNADASDAEIERVCKLAQADEFVQKMPEKYDTYIEQGGSNVSGGQKQRLCIARALLKKPKILILDDSTSAVDTKTDALIQRAFAEEIPDTTKIIIAQRISSVEHADKIVVMENGRIDAIGTHETLLESNAIYQEVYASQVKGVGANA